MRVQDLLALLRSVDGDGRGKEMSEERGVANVGGSEEGRGSIC
jgi:hypothetical protein